MSNTALKKSQSKQRAQAVASNAKAVRQASVNGIPAPIKRAAERDVAKTLRMKPSQFKAMHTQARPIFASDGKIQDDVGFLEPDAIHPSFHSASTDTGMRVTGVEYIKPLGDDGLLETGDNLGSFLFNPLAIGARLPLIAVNYARWKANRVRLCYKSAIAPVGTDANGLLLMGANMDPEAPLPEDNLSGVVAGQSFAPNATIESVWKSFCIDLVLNKDKQNELYVSNAGDPRLLYQFRAFIMAATPLADVAYGAWMIAYDVTFDEPTMDTDAIGQYLSGTTLIKPSALRDAYLFVGFNAAPTTRSNYLASYIGEGEMFDAADSTGLVGDLDFYRITDDGSLVLPPGTYTVEVQQAYGTDTTAPTTCNSSGSPSNDGMQPLTGTFTNYAVLAASSVNSTVGPMTGGFAKASWQGLDIDAYFVANLPTGKGFGVSAYTSTFTITSLATIAAVVWGHTYNNSGVGQQAVRFSITRTGAGSVADADTNPSNALLRARGINGLLEMQRLDTLFERQVKRALKDAPEDSAELRVVATVFCASRVECSALLASAKPNATAATMILPAIGAVVSWFVQRYGPRLGKAATEWAVRKIEHKLR